jgi:hypothetical protein
VRAHDPRRAQEIIAKVVQGFDRYVKDVPTYRAARELLLEEVDRYTTK